MAQASTGVSDVVMSRAELGQTELPVYEGIPLDRISLVVSESLAEEVRHRHFRADCPAMPRAAQHFAKVEHIAGGNIEP